MQTARGSGSAIAAAAGVLYTWRAEPPRIIRTSTGPRVELLLAEPSLVEDPGAALFHRKTPSGLACASCHPEGGDDGHVWDVVGVGPRRTQPLLGGVTERAPFHWAGDVPDLATVLGETFVRRMGGEETGPTEAREMADWLGSLPAPRPSIADPAAALAGRAAFEAAGCAGCHAGDALSDEENHDVGTGGAFQTPSLRGLPLRAPYFHDGCAPVLAGVIDGSCGGPAHAVDEPDRAVVLAYLRAL